MDVIEQVDLSNENEEENDIPLPSKKKRNFSMITKSVLLLNTQKSI